MFSPFSLCLPPALSDIAQAKSSLMVRDRGKGIFWRGREESVAYLASFEVVMLSAWEFIDNHGEGV
jgi:hypothetical protein